MFNRSAATRRSLRQRRLASAVRSVVERLEERALFSFTTPVAYNVGGLEAHGVATGDFNRDGKADLVVANYMAQGTVSVLLGNGDGTFAPKADFAAGAYANEITIADFNGDGAQDLAVQGTSIGILLGNGDGTFRAPVTSPAVGAQHAPAAGDFNKDGKMDLAYISFTGVSVLNGNGDGTFSAGASYAAGGSAELVIAGDLNNDGAIDLATPNAVSGGTVSVLMNNGDGTFKPYVSYAAFSAPFTMAGGDFNHDGYEDFAVANSYTSSAITVVLNNGDGTYGPPTVYQVPEAPFGIEVGDYNGDGVEDLAEHGPGAVEVQLGKGDGSFYAAAPTPTLSGPLGFGTSGDFNGDGADDLVGPANGGFVTVLTNTNNDRASLAGAVTFGVSMPSMVMAGSTVPMTVSALDAQGNVVSNFAGTVYISSNDPQMKGQLQAYTFTAADAGVHSFLKTVTLNTLGTQTVQVGAPFMTEADSAVLVTPRAVRLGMATSVTSVGAGSTLNVTVSALDATGSPAIGYGGTVTFSSTDSQSGLPASYTFTAEDAGVHTFTLSLKTAGTQLVGVSDPTGLSGSTTVAVTPGNAVGLSIAGGSGAIGIARTVVISAIDAYGNVDTSYNGTLNLSTSDAAARFPSSVAIVNGRAVTAVTLMTVGADAVTATDPATGLTLTANLDATPAIAVGYAISSASATIAGAPMIITVTVNNSIGQVAADYTGTVSFSSTDLRAGLPASYTFTAADAGTHTFALSLVTAGTQMLTLRDVSNTLVSTGAPITVAPAALASLAMSGPKGTTAGQSQDFILTARDVYGNIATNFTGAVQFTSTDGQAALPGTYTFTAADAGVHVFSIALKTAGGQVVTATAAGNPLVTVSLSDLNVAPTVATHFSINAPSNVSTGVAFTLKVVALDVYGNTAADTPARCTWRARCWGRCRRITPSPRPTAGCTALARSSTPPGR